MTGSHARRATGAGLAVLAAALIGAAMFASAAHADRTCSVTRFDYPGNGYFTSLKVHRTTCATGRKVALAWYHCRIKHGIFGHCHQRVLGFSCKEGKRYRSPIEFDARVTCHRKTQTVIHTYQQDT